jgi:hypothetical protein
MSAYNTLSINVECLHCGKKYESKLQFKAGEVWQYDYQLNDLIKDSPGDKSIARRKIKAYGILEDEICPNCGNVNKEDYEILIDRGLIKGYQVATDISRYIFPNNTDFYIVPDDSDV